MRPSQRQFGPVASEYLASGVHANEGALRRLVEVVGTCEGTVLDVGTGAGHAAFVFAPRVQRVVATDITAQMLNVAREHAATLHLENLVACFALAEALPFGADTFEGLVCRLAAHHFDHPAEFLAEARRVVKPGGWLLIVDNVGIEDPESDDLLDRLERARDPSHVRNWRESQWREWITEAGFDLQLVERTPKPLNAHDWLKRMRVKPRDQAELLSTIYDSEGWLRDYLRPHGDGVLLTFHLHEMLALAR